MKPIFANLRAGFACVIVTACAVLHMAAIAQAETLVERNVDSRAVLAFRVNPSALERWLPAGWQAHPPSQGASTGANLFLTFVDRLSSLDPEGRPRYGGTLRMLSISVPVKHVQTGDAGSMVIRMYAGNPAYVPGPYKATLAAEVAREAASSGTDAGPGSGLEHWTVSDGNGGVLEFHAAFQRALPVRARNETRVYSAVDPAFYRIYRYEDGTDVVRSRPAGIDRVQELRLRMDLPELRSLFDGTEELVSLAIRPWYVREVFLP